MKIAFDSQIFSQQRYGGISRYYHKLASELSNLSQDVSIFAGVHKNHYLSLFPDGVVRGYMLSRFPPKTSKIINKGNHYLADYQMRQWRPEVIHETYYSNYISSLKATPRVLTVYDMIHELYASEFPKKDIVTQRKRNACHRANHIISISDNTKKDLIELFEIPPEKITVIHLACDIYIKPDHNSSSSSDYSKPFLLFVGSREGYKNFNGLLKAISLSKKLINDFNIIAFGGGIFSAEENVLIHTLGFKKNQVRQVGGDDSVLALLYQSAAAFVYPSLYEGFGIPPLEAMAYECPVISSNTSSMPEVVGLAGEFFNPNDNESIRSSIENVVYSPAHISELKAKGLDTINNFSWKKCAKETLKIYESLII